MTFVSVSRSRDRPLRAVRPARVLGAPVEVDDHRVGARVAGIAGVGDDRLRSRLRRRRRVLVERPIGRRPEAVGRIRVAHESDLDPGDPEDRRLPGGPLRREGAGVRDAPLVERRDRPGDARHPLVERVVRCGAAGVEAALSNRPRQVRGGVEDRVRGGRPGAHRRLGVTEGQVCSLLEIGADPAEERCEVVLLPAAIAKRAIEQRLVHQQVAARGDREPPPLGPGLRCARRTLARARARSARGRGLAAPSSSGSTQTSQIATAAPATAAIANPPASSLPICYPGWGSCAGASSSGSA